MRMANMFGPFVISVSLLFSGCSDDTNGGVDQGSADTQTSDTSDVCSLCKADEVCVQSFDGTCTTTGASCVKVSADCLGERDSVGLGCAAACESESACLLTNAALPDRHAVPRLLVCT